MGHYKLAHIRTNIIISLLHYGVLFFLLSWVIESPTLFHAFHFAQPSVYAGMVIFMILYSPVSIILAALMSALSRRHEFQADRYAVETTGQAGPLVQALKTLSRTNLDNLTPHPAYVRLAYSHPPLIERLARLDEVEASLKSCQPRD
ncbi:MAG: M48 family metalloprotease [Myxococcota bacterium]|nr:M48 family metalloprotease [Myxococcota bacterium]